MKMKILIMKFKIIKIRKINKMIKVKMGLMILIVFYKIKI
jgi:hypothetical protein